MFTGEGKKFKTPTHIYRHVYTYTKKKEKELPVNLKTTKHAPLFLFFFPGVCLLWSVLPFFNI